MLSAPMSDYRNAGLCFLVVVAAALLTLPWLEMGVADDFSYNYTALVFAETGRFTYNGWATAMLGAQVLWAALFIKLIGFSFTLVRLCMLPFAGGCAALVYAIARRTGLIPANAALLALTIALAPSFLSLAPSFMTDIFGLFFFLLSVYGAVRASEEGLSRGVAITWLLLSFFSGVIGGSARQSVWVAPLFVLPMVAWYRRSERGVAGVTLVLWLLTLVAAKAFTDWFAQQPYAIVDNAPSLQGIRGRVIYLVSNLPVWPMTLVFLLLPVFVAAAPLWKRENPPARRRLQLFALLSTAALLLLFMAAGSPYDNWPYIKDSSSLFVFFLNTTRPTFLPGPVRFVILGLVFWVALLPVGVLLARVWGQRRATATDTPLLSSWGEAIQRFFNRSSHEERAFSVLAAATLGYLTLLLLRLLVIAPPLFDRYFLPLLPLLGAALLRPLQGEGRALPAGATVAAWGTLLLTSGYTLGRTHDHFAFSRARLAAVAALEADGVSKAQICAGLDHDGWTQIKKRGYINDGRLRLPPEAYRPAPPGALCLNTRWQELLLDLEPTYFLVPLRKQGLKDSKYRPVPYTLWLPPFRAEVYTQVVPVSNSGETHDP